MKYKCPKCNTIFEGELESCPQCGQKMVYNAPNPPSQLIPEDTEGFETKEQSEKRKKQSAIGFSIAAIIVAIITSLIYLVLVLNLGHSVDTIFSSVFEKFIPWLWGAMVRELFTFVFFLCAIIICVIGVFVFILFILALGPIGALVAIILSIVSCAIPSRKWYSFVSLGISVLSMVADIFFLLNFIIK